MPTKKILLSAYSCSPNAGSEPGIGWNWAQAIAARGLEVTVITRTINKVNIESLRQGSSYNPQFVFHDLPALVQKIYKLPFGNYIYYLLWQYTAAKRAVKLHRREGFDQVQHITWGSFRAPSFMGRLGIPFVFGPVGGGEETPKLLRKGMGWRGRLWDLLRRISNNLLAVDPFMRSTYANTTEILAATSETLSKIPLEYRPRARIQASAGMSPASFQGQFSIKALNPDSGVATTLQVLYVGRLVPWKGLHLALQALAVLGEKRRAVQFTLIGAGNDGPRLKEMARRLNVENSVRWIPWIPRDELLTKISDFDLFLFPSLHDSGGMAVLEALSAGVPVICLDLGGPSEFVDDTCGRVVLTRGADESGVVERIGRCLAEFVEDPNKLKQLSKGARERANSFAWDAHVRNVYGESLVLRAD